MIVWVYNRFGEQVDCLYDLMNFAYDDEIGKLETIEFEVLGTPLTKGDFLVWRDEFDIWHEDIVASCDVIHQGSVYQHVYAEDSLTELAFYYINERDSYNLENTFALERCLENTRWSQGIVDHLGEGDIKFYHESAYDGITEMLDIWGGEISTTKRVNKNGVYERLVNWQKQKGEDYGLVFYYGFDADQIERHVELDNVYTRVHVFGKGEQIYNEDGTTSGYSRRITFADLNNGKDYLENDDALLHWGVLDKNGKLAHAEGTVIFEDCEDEAELLKLGEAYLKQVSQPQVSYTANLAILKDAGVSFINARAGDTVYIRDEVLDERLVGRVMHVRRYLDNSNPTELTLGNVIHSAPELWAEQQSALRKMQQRSASWDDAASANSDWLRNVKDALNEQINATGGFAYWDDGEGITVYDRKRDDNPTMAIQLKGGSLRIANSKNSLGEWEWSTFGTGDGFTADCIIAGIIKGGANYWNLNTGELYFRDGGIYDSTGRNYWDLTNGEFRLSPGVIYDDEPLEDYFNNIWFEINEMDDSLVELDTELRAAMEDGIVTEAEAAAVAKILQRIQTEQVESIDVYEKVYNSSYLTGDPKTKLYNAKVSLYGVNNSSGNYGDLVEAINGVIDCDTATDLEGAMDDYLIAYQAYQSTRQMFSEALSNAQEAMSQAYADKAAESAFDSVSATDIFNRLTGGGTNQGIYMSGGKLYLNGEYMQMGYIRDQANKNYWNLVSGQLTTTDMSATNMSATGTFRCGATTSYNIYMNNGTLYGYSGSAQVGYINATAGATSTTGISLNGMLMYSSGCLMLATPYLLTGNHLGTNSLAQGYTGYVSGASTILTMNGLIYGYY